MVGVTSTLIESNRIKLVGVADRITLGDGKVTLGARVGSGVGVSCASAGMGELVARPARFAGL